MLEMEAEPQSCLGKLLVVDVDLGACCCTSGKGDMSGFRAISFQSPFSKPMLNSITLYYNFIMYVYITYAVHMLLSMANCFGQTSKMQLELLGFWTSSGTLNTRKYNVSETGSVSVLR
jgi:hypothetical protein